jgi:signal transduction histidine kinase/streptogramin lyase
VAADNNGRLWWAKEGEIGIVTNGLFRVVQKLNPQPMRLAAASEGGMWVCCGHQLLKCDEAGNVTDYGEFHPDNSGTVATTMLEDKDGDIWIGTTYNGLYHHTDDGFQTVATSHGGILSLIEDREGSLWAGTFGGGLNRIRPRAITLDDEQAGLPFSSIESICEETNGVVWAVTQNGVVVRKINDRWQPFAPANPGSDWPSNVTCVTVDAENHIWMGTHNQGLFCWHDGRFIDFPGAEVFRNQTLHTLLVSKSGDLWVGQETPNAILHVHHGTVKKFPFSNDPRIFRAMAEDTNGDIWVASSRGSLYRIHDDEVTDVTPRKGENMTSIRCLRTTPDGAVWIGYAGTGVGRLKDGRYTEIGTPQGLFDDYVSHIVADDQGWLWFGANRGLFKVRLEDFDNFAAGKLAKVRSIHYGKGEGLPSLQATFGDSPDVLRDHEGRLWIPMQTALAVIDPGKIYEHNSPPASLLTRVLVDDRVVAQYNGVLPPDKSIQVIPEALYGPAQLKLPPDHRNVRFEFTAFDFSAPENVRFRHRLHGVEENWTEAQANDARAVIIQTLGYGDYDFEVAACNGDGDWSQNTATIALTVTPFFWQTFWFRSLVVLAFTLSIIAVVRYVSFRRLRAQLRVLEQQAALQRERARIAKDIHDDLGANLTQIAYLGELANQDREEPKLVGDRIRTISATARQAVKALDEIVWAVNPRNDTLAHLLDYSGQYAVDYLRTVGIRCRLDFPEDIPARELSTDLRHNLFLVVKEALHNIFKHANATEVHLRVAADEYDLKIVIEDNGCGFTNAPDNALSDGLRNMKQRMAEVGGDCTIEGRVGSGTIVTVRLPWRKND